METYWDLSRPERARLTAFEVEKYLDLELMVKGVLRVPPPEIIPEEEPTVNRKTYWKVRDGLVFETAEAAQSFFALRPLSIDHDYKVGYDTRVSFASPLEVDSATIVMLIPHDEFPQYKTALSKWQEAKNSNARARTAFDEASKAVSDCLSGLWEDWHECRKEAMESCRTFQTWRKYLDLAKDREVAFRFLQAACSERAIRNARDWAVTEGDSLPEEDKLPRNELCYCYKEFGPPETEI